MVISDSGIEGGSRGGVGLQLGVIISESVKTVIKLTLGSPVLQVGITVRLVKQLSQPLFFFFLGLQGAHVWQWKYGWTFWRSRFCSCGFH